MVIFNFVIGMSALFLPVYLYHTLLTVLDRKETKPSVQESVDTEFAMAQA